MNKERRKRIDDIIKEVEAAQQHHDTILAAAVARFNALLESSQDEIQGVLDDEQEAFDNLPEGLQQAERGNGMEVAIEALTTAKDHLDELSFDCESAIQSLEDAKGY